MLVKRILIVEDDKMICSIFSMFIKELGHQMVGISPNGQDAIIKATESKPDIILMDIHLQGEINGIETARIINDALNIPVIYISSDIEESTLKEAILSNTYGFLVKPIYKTTLGITIEFAYFKHIYDQQNKMNAEPSDSE